MTHPHERDGRLPFVLDVEPRMAHLLHMHMAAFGQLFSSGRSMDFRAPKIKEAVRRSPGLREPCFGTILGAVSELRILTGRLRPLIVQYVLPEMRGFRSPPSCWPDFSLLLRPHSELPACSPQTDTGFAIKMLLAYGLARCVVCLLLWYLPCTSAFFRNRCPYSLGLARLDPIVSPGQVSRHVHFLHGGSGKCWPRQS